MSEKRMLEEFIELAEIDSASGEERAVADRLRQKLESLGFVLEWDDAGSTFDGNCGNLFAYRNGEKSGAVCFCSHMDRVPGGKGIHPVLKDGVLYSSGDTILAADDLSGVVAILEGVRIALAEGSALPRIEILFTVGEEAGLYGAKAFDLSKLESDMIYLLDSPGHFGRIINAAPGRSMLEIEVFGKAAHAGNEPEKGIDAAKTMAEMLASMKTGRIDEITTSNFSSLYAKSASAMNVVCDHAVLRGEMRSREAERLDDYEAYVQSVCTGIAEKRGAKVKFRREDTFRPFVTPVSSSIVQYAQKAFDELDTPCVINAGGGGMDGNVFAAKGKSCVGIATGYFHNHTKEECLYLEDFYKASFFVAKVISYIGA